MSTRDQFLQVEPEQTQHILTSMLERVDVAAYDMIEVEVQGTFTGGFHSYDLAAGGVGWLRHIGWISRSTSSGRSYRELSR